MEPKPDSGTSQAQKDAWANAFAAGEVSRIRSLKETLGEGTYAESVGQSIVTHQVLLISPELRETGKAVIKALQPDVQEISTRPDLAARFVQGVTKELISRRLFDEPTRQA